MIYKCLPQTVSRIWGSLPPEQIGEEPGGEIWWFFSDTILENDRGDNCGACEFFPADSFPLIIKTLHAARDLSVQVHPGKDRTKPMKDESWVVLNGHGRIMHGAIDGTTPLQFKNALEDGSIESILQYVNGEPGVFVHLPAGTIHALGAGLTVLEVQLNCTVTYRLWDYARKDINGNLRELHVEQGLSAINWETMGRATEVSGCYLDAGSYYMRKTGPGEIILKSLEIAFLPEEQQCFFADSAGGIISINGEAWIVGIEE
ncbi:MAG: class I mannose-6-phosphate isomerase [Candidatus Sabulitectum sp.]|nr:class I mannose-6-phosphate isomerase [Candidatus Sabulitectum sp.]